MSWTRRLTDRGGVSETGNTLLTCAKGGAIPSQPR